MELNKNLVIINNEKIFINNNNYYCENVDIKTLTDGLDRKFNILMLARQSKIKKSHKFDTLKIKPASSILNFLINVFKTLSGKNTKYLIISITPYTFFAYLILFLFRKKVFLYLRSNGYEEYKLILGFLGPLIYHLMYSIMTLKSNIIVCQERLSKKKGTLVFPSQLDDSWFRSLTKPQLDKPRLLYVGRIKVEKGVFSLFKIYEELKNSLELSVVGNPENLKKKDKNINFIGHGYDSEALIKIYDNNSIFILPSFTEAHPQVLYEALARLRPVIIFNEISHVVNNKNGIFISERNSASFLTKINYIMNNYSTIQDSMKKNKLPTKKDFIFKMSEILN